MAENVRLESPPSTLPPGSTVWAYLRDSGGPTQDRSVEQQRDEIIRYCQKYGLVLLRPPFEDIHKTGTTTKNRNEFDYMMSLSASKPLRPDGLIIWNHARFSRGGPYDAQLYKSTLRSRGIIIHSLTDRIPEGQFAPVIESLIDAANQQKAEEASMGAWRGLRSNVKQGAVPGTPPIGMKRKPITIVSEQGVKRTAHRWDPDPTFKYRINQAFKLKAQGRSLAQIHRETKLFTSINSYITFFRNPIYIGTLKYGDMLIDNYCKATIPRTVFEKVQTLMEQYAQRRHMTSETDHPRRKISGYLFSGIIRCARCGSVMNGMSSPQPYGEDYRRYQCAAAKIQKTCSAKPIPAKLIEQLVISELDKFFSNPQNLINQLTQFKNDQSSHQVIVDAKNASLSAQLGTVRKGITNTTNAIAKHGISNALSKSLAALEEDEKEVYRQIAELKLKSSMPIIVPTHEQAMHFAKRIKQDLHSEDPTIVRQTLLGIVHEVTVDRIGKHLIGRVVYYHTPEVKKKPLTETVPISRPPVGAPIYRHSISFEGIVPNRGRPRKTKRPHL